MNTKGVVKLKERIDVFVFGWIFIVILLYIPIQFILTSSFSVILSAFIGLSIVLMLCSTTVVSPDGLLTYSWFPGGQKRSLPREVISRIEFIYGPARNPNIIKFHLKNGDNVKFSCTHSKAIEIAEVLGMPVEIVD